MISAKDAVRLVEESDVALQARLDKISLAIEAAAMNGKRQIDLWSADPSDTAYHVSVIPYRPVVFTATQMVIVDKLKQRGFRAEIIKEATQNRRPWRIHDEGTIEYTISYTHSIIIKW